MLIFQRCHRNFAAYKEEMLAGPFYAILSSAFIYFFYSVPIYLNAKMFCLSAKPNRVTDLAGRVWNELGAIEVGHTTNN